MHIAVLRVRDYKTVITIIRGKISTCTDLALKSIYSSQLHAAELKL